MEIPNQDRIGITNLFLNPESGQEWDIIVDNGQIITISDTEYISQKLKQLLLTGFGEVKTNTEYGIPWLTEILGVKNPDLESIATIILDIIEQDDILKQLGVVSSDIPNIELDEKTRTLIISVVLKLTNGSEITIDGVQL